MTAKLYVTNLSASATLSSLRQRFNAYGEVVDVEFLAERSARPTSAAYVTVATGASASKAVDALHGAMLHDRMLLVTVAPGSRAAARKGESKLDAASGVHTTQQYRDRHATSYELSAGSRLTLTFAFPEHDGAAWRLRAAIAGEQLADVEASAHSRDLAFMALSEACEHSASSQLAAVHWLEVAAALRSVSAI